MRKISEIEVKPCPADEQKDNCIEDYKEELKQLIIDNIKEIIKKHEKRLKPVKEMEQILTGKTTKFISAEEKILKEIFEIKDSALNGSKDA